MSDSASTLYPSFKYLEHFEQSFIYHGFYEIKRATHKQIDKWLTCLISNQSIPKTIITMSQPLAIPKLPEDLEDVFTAHENDPEALLTAFMPVFCDHVKADRMFIQPRNPDTRVCKVLRWRRSEDIPMPAIPGNIRPNEWFVEDRWEVEDPLWRSALNLKPSIYIEDLQKAANEGLLNIDFENKYMFHTAFIHAHAHWPPLPSTDDKANARTERKFYGSVQPAVFNGPRVWGPEVHELVGKCVERLAPVMKSLGETAPSLESFGIA
ncbi:hypothetical protein ONS95_013617 [Cadophora gregata]|nr:uncharacterized protein ONS95_013617 [Cadophora gregata]KAK0113363.1 hypothetical protein ONS96_014228 [Cadophora gregata f. sp. sojae]KAK0114113.1 hypothetical protein ONS95_013617 [Cadophora gregata]